jgi:hypothetical protein
VHLFFLLSCSWLSKHPQFTSLQEVWCIVQSVQRTEAGVLGIKHLLCPAGDCCDVLLLLLLLLLCFPTVCRTLSPELGNRSWITNSSIPDFACSATAAARQFYGSSGKARVCALVGALSRPSVCD